MKDISILISRYLKNTISSAEQNELESALELNPDMQIALSEEVAIHNLFIEKEVMDRGADFRNFLNEKHNTNSQIKKAIVASSIIIAVGISSWIVLDNNSTNENQIYPQKSSSQQIILNDNSNVNKGKESDSIVSKNVKSAISNPSVNQMKSVAELSNNTISKENTVVNSQQINVVKSPVNNQTNSGNPVSNKKETLINNVTTDICADFNPKIKVQTSKSQLEKETGRIELKTNVKGLQYSINGQDYQSQSVFEELAAATYSLWIKNENNCINTVNDINVKVTLCTNEYQNSFSPTAEENWVVPVRSTENFTVSILNSSRAIVLETNSHISQNPIWNGKDMKNNSIPEGLYKAIVEYKDKETCVFNITIIK